MKKLEQAEMHQIQGGSNVWDLGVGVAKVFGGIIGTIKDGVVEGVRAGDFETLSDRVLDNPMGFGKIELKIGDESLKIDNSSYFDSLTPNMEVVSII